MMHEFSYSVNKVNKAVVKVRTIEDRLPSRYGSAAEPFAKIFSSDTGHSQSSRFL